MDATGFDALGVNNVLTAGTGLTPEVLRVLAAQHPARRAPLGISAPKIPMQPEAEIPVDMPL